MAEDLRVLHPAFNRMRSKMMRVEENNDFTSKELILNMASVGIYLKPMHITEMVALGLLDKYGKGRYVRYKWHQLIASDYSEVMPSCNTFIRIFSDATKHSRERNNASYHTRMQHKAASLEEAVAICKQAGLTVQQTVKTVTGEKVITL